MRTDLLDLLVSDHKRIRSLLRQVRQAGKTAGAPKDAFFADFLALKTLVLAHTTAEEKSLYGLFADMESEKMSGLRDLSLEGFEEHALIERLLKELSHPGRFPEEWKAKFSVLDDLLRRHFADEENEFFPLARGALGKEELTALGELYVEKREDVLLKERLPKEVSRAMNLQ